MPGVDGYELLSALRERAGGSYLPVLVLTADTTHQAINRALDLGARDFVTKPFDIDEVTLRVRNLLETKELHTTLRHHNITLRRQIGDFERAAESEQEARQGVLDRITAVLESRDVRMVFQPIVQMPGDRVVGCEALARFTQTPQQGPDRWFADAERVGLGTQLELLAVANALGRLRDLPAEMFMAVNVSPPTALARELHDLLDQVDGERVVLELTEHVPVEDYEAVGAGLAELRRRGDPARLGRHRRGLRRLPAPARAQSGHHQARHLTLPGHRPGPRTPSTGRGPRGVRQRCARSGHRRRRREPARAADVGGPQRALAAGLPSGTAR